MKAEKFCSMDENFELLISASRIRRRVNRIGAEIAARLDKDGIEELHMLWIAEGAIMFAADLARAIGRQVMIHSIRASSYGNALHSSGEVIFQGDISGLGGKHVVIVDDILDTGRTICAVMKLLGAVGASSVQTCFLLDKKIEDKKFLTPDYVGFEIEPVYVFGYGLDMAQKYRSLPDLHYLKQ